MNKKISIVKAIALVSFVLTMAGCSNFDEINTNPDKATQVTPGWLATYMLNYITKTTAQETSGFKEPYNLSKYILWTEKQTGLQYNRLERTNDKLTPLRNIKPMIKNASDENKRKSYQALGHFLRAWQFFQVTMRVGDIPYAEALMGDEGVIKPKYDMQKDVFKGILSELDEANRLFSEGSQFEGDFIYRGNTDQWQRLVNSFQLYVLINLDKKSGDSDLNVINKFKEVAARPLMRDFNDNFAMTFNGSKGYCYPWSNTPVSINSFVEYSMLSTYYINTLRDNKDFRLFYVAEPSEQLIAAGKLESDFDAYEGVEPSDSYDKTVEAKTAKAYSDLNRRYVDEVSAEPVGLLCHWDIQFILAEAAARGWITDSAQEHYANGIKSSMNFYVKYADSKYTHGVSMDEAYINSYPSTDGIALEGDLNNQIKQIIWQKYLAGFFHNEYQAWFEFRRTGYPEFILNPNTNENITNKDLFPTRWMYSQNELDYNTDNMNEAVKRQYNGSDDFNGTMWILQ
ncbi:MAG: SusD/RagB family nutrient-binding outer membrane lipoprotein [Phocaeicola sp.]